jgi:hypothetical protein
MVDELAIIVPVLAMFWLPPDKLSVLDAKLRVPVFIKELEVPRLKAQPESKYSVPLLVNGF